MQKTQLSILIGIAAVFAGLWFLYGTQVAAPTESIDVSASPNVPSLGISNSYNSSSTMQVRSAQFKNTGSIPYRYTCDGEDVSPPLTFNDIADEAVTLALLVEDPDAPSGTWDHWIVYNIPASTHEVKEGEEPQGVGGVNSWGRIGYGGPCPPSGEHRYIFSLFALNDVLDLPVGASKDSLLDAMEGKIIDQATLVGRYERSEVKE
jgi:hypothetical protein